MKIYVITKTSVYGLDDPSTTVERAYSSLEVAQTQLNTIKERERCEDCGHNTIGYTIPDEDAITLYELHEVELGAQ